MTIILFNAVTLCFVWVGIDQDLAQKTEVMQEFFNTVFIIEAIIKIVAYKVQYFKVGWNVFDFFVVCGGIFGWVFKNALSQKLSVIRILRVCRVLRLLRKAKRLYVIFNSFIHTIPAFGNVGSLIIVLIYIFSILGNRMFATVKISGSLNHYVNFQNFGNSFLTLIIAMTGEGWFQIMLDLSKKKSVSFDCIENPTYQDYVDNNYQTVGCGNEAAFAFFLLYMFSVSLILVNLFIAVTLQGFDEI